MSNRNKAKGTSWETQIVGYLNEWSLNAHRTGSADAGSGDIHYGTGWTVEAKNEARIDLPGYLRQLETEVIRSNRKLYKAAVWVKARRRPVSQAYVIMSADAYCLLVSYVQKLEGVIDRRQATDNQGVAALRS